MGRKAVANVVITGIARLVVAAIIICIFALVAHADGPAPVTQATTIFTLVRDEIKTRLQVPTAYIDRDQTGAADQGADLYLKMQWPSLASTSVRFGAIDQQQYDEKERFLLSGRAFNIDFHQGKLARMNAIIKDHIKNDWVPFAGAAPLPEFTRYVDRITEYYVAKKHQIGFQILLPKDKVYMESLYIECPLNYISSKGLYCTAHISFGHYVYGEYSFSLANLPDWKGIDSAARQLFNKMYIHYRE